MLIALLQEPPLLRVTHWRLLLALLVLLISAVCPLHPVGLQLPLSCPSILYNQESASRQISLVECMFDAVAATSKAAHHIGMLRYGLWDSDFECILQRSRDGIKLLQHIRKGREKY